MNRTKVIRQLALSLLLGASVFAAPTYAQINFNISLAPPAPQHEVVPAVQQGYVWAPGYWAWNGERHIWVRGRTIVQREGYLWTPDRWAQGDRGYFRTAGHWEHDKGYKPVKMKKEKKQKKQKHHDDNGKHKGNKNRG